MLRNTVQLPSESAVNETEVEVERRLEALVASGFVTLINEASEGIETE